MMARETFLEEEGLDLSIGRLREGKGCGTWGGAWEGDFLRPYAVF
jgi:hypothetical protein